MVVVVDVADVVAVVVDNNNDDDDGMIRCCRPPTETFINDVLTSRTFTRASIPTFPKGL